MSDAGVIFGSDMTTEAALTKLAYILGKSDWDLSTKTMVKWIPIICRQMLR